MVNLFNADFTDFLRSLYNHKVEHLLVGGYAVILHGYTRSTADMDIWVNKTIENYYRLKKAFAEFGAPVFSENDFLSGKYDVWAIGREPNKIEIMSQVKGLDFLESLGRFKDMADIEQLKKKLKE
jgi:hypothetical protein